MLQASHKFVEVRRSVISRRSLIRNPNVIKNGTVFSLLCIQARVGTGFADEGGAPPVYGPAGGS